MNRNKQAFSAVLALGLLAGCATRIPASFPTSAAPEPALPAPPDIADIPDAVPRQEPRSARGNPPFYDVFGKRYFVLLTAAGYTERGVASWYGPGFHRGRTAIGEPYDMHAMTAAHKTLPLPAYVQVTNLKNGKSVVVRVNDRGPFKDGRIIDLSRTAALKLDMVRDGTAFVEVRVLTPGNAAEPIAAKASEFYVQAGAFADPANANTLASKLHSQGYGQAFVRNDVINGQALYRVRVGPIPNVGEFDRVIAQLKILGVRDAQLALD